MQRHRFHQGFNEASPFDVGTLIEEASYFSEIFFRQTEKDYDNQRNSFLVWRPVRFATFMSAFNETFRIRTQPV